MPRVAGPNLHLCNLSLQKLWADIPREEHSPCIAGMSQGDNWKFAPGSILQTLCALNSQRHKSDRGSTVLLAQHGHCFLQTRRLNQQVQLWHEEKRNTHTHTHILAVNPYSCQVWEWWEQKRDHCCHFLGPLRWHILAAVLMSLAGSEGLELPNLSFAVQCPTFHSVYHTLSPQYTVTIKKIIICIC